MQEIIDFILFENHQLNNSQDIGLSDIGVYTDKDGFFKYMPGYLKLIVHLLKNRRLKY